MTLGELLESVLNATVTLYPGEAPPKPPTPYAVYTHYRLPNVGLQGASNLQNAPVQIDVYASTYLVAETLANSIEVLMAAQVHYASPTVFSSTPIHHEYFGVDRDVKLHRVMLEFSVWYYP